jgi:hypothetical protein
MASTSPLHSNTPNLRWGAAARDRLAWKLSIAANDATASFVTTRNPSLSLSTHPSHLRASRRALLPLDSDSCCLMT